MAMEPIRFNHLRRNPMPKSMLRAGGAAALAMLSLAACTVNEVPPGAVAAPPAQQPVVVSPAPAMQPAPGSTVVVTPHTY